MRAVPRFFTLACGLVFCLAQAWGASGLPEIFQASGSAVVQEAVLAAAQLENRRGVWLEDLRKHEKDIEPLVAEVLKLKEQEARSSWFWRRGWLKYRLGKLQEILANIRRDEQAVRAANDGLFRLYTGLDEELNTLLDQDLARWRYLKPADRLQTRQKLKTLWSQKEWSSGRLEGLGFSEERPFQLAQLPDTGNSPASPEEMADRQKALQARSIQLAAWEDLLKRNLEICGSLKQDGILGAAVADPRLKALRQNQAKVRELARKNDQDLARVPGSSSQ